MAGGNHGVLPRTESFEMNSLERNLRYGNVVRLEWRKDPAYVSYQGDEHDSTSSLLLEKHVSNLIMISFKIEAEIGQHGDVNYGSKIKLLHINSKKYISYGDEFSQSNKKDKQVCLSDYPTKYCELELLRKLDGTDNNTIPIKMNDEVMICAQKWILAWDGNTTGLMWRKMDGPLTSLDPEFTFTIQPYGSDIMLASNYRINFKDVDNYFQMSKLEKQLKQPLPKGGNQKNPIYQNKLIDQGKLIDQNRLIQNYLREQPNGATNHHSNGDATNHHSNDGVTNHHSNSGATNQDDHPVQPYSGQNSQGTNQVVKICEIFHKHNQDNNHNTTKALIDLLIQICVGNFDNQKVFLGDKEYVKNISKILKESLQDCENQECSHYCKGDYTYCIGKSEKIKVLLQLKASAISLLEILCEEIHPKTKENVIAIATYVDVITLHETMYDCYLLRNNTDHEIAELACDTAIKTHNLLKHMEDFDDIKAVPSKHLLQSGDWNPKSIIIDSHYHHHKDHQKAWNYCLEWSRSVEILYKNEKGKETLAKVHFRLHPEDKMTADEENIVKHKVHCGAPDSRLAQFLLGMKSIEHKVHPRHFKKCPSLRAKLVCYAIWLNYILTIWTVVLNIMLIIAWENVDIKSENVYNSPDDRSTSNGSLLNTYCTEAVCYNSSVNSSMFVPENCNSSLCTSETLVPTAPDINDHPHWFFSYALYIGGIIHLLLSIIMLAFFFVLNAQDFSSPHPKQALNNFYLYMAGKREPTDHFEKQKSPEYFEMTFRCTCFRLLYVFGFVGCSILALKFYGYFYCLCLLHIIVDNLVLQQVLKSVTRNFPKLFWLVSLGLIITYIYSIGAFAFFANEIDDPDREEAAYCDSLFQCWITIFHYILIGGVSSNLPTNFSDFAIRVIFFEVTFYIFITIIGINIFYAIVVDTFIELREEWWKIERDNKQICFICQKFSFEFEEKAKGFDHHIMNDHYMFNYVYFKLHADHVVESGGILNAMEWYVRKQYIDNRIEFFPLHHAKCLSHTLTNKKLKNKVCEIKKMLSEIEDQVNAQTN